MAHAEPSEKESLDFVENLDTGSPDAQREQAEELLNFALSSENHTLQGLAVELAKLNEDLGAKEKDFKKQILHIETITMMAKYQLVFIKMENFWKKVESILRRGAVDNKERFFRKIQMRAREKPFRQLLAVGRLKKAVSLLGSVLRRRQTLQQASAFSMIGQVSRISLNLVVQDAELGELRLKLLDRDRSIKKLRRELASSTTNSSYVMNLLQKKPSKETLKRRDTIDDVRTSKDILKSLQDKNDALEAKLKATEKQILKFIADMSLQIQTSHSVEPSTGGLLHETSRNKLFKLHSKIPSNS